MNAGTVATLLADLIDPTGPVPVVPAAAKPANREQACGLAADRQPCEALRISANAPGAATAACVDSQDFGAIRKSPNDPQSEHRRGLSQDSQHSHADRAPYEAVRELETSPEPYERGRFLDRRARLLRWGWPEPEAVGLAERLAERDREQDDRVSCAECRHYRPGRCGNYEQARLSGRGLSRDLISMLQRCLGFSVFRSLSSDKGLPERSRNAACASQLESNPDA